MAIIGYIRVSSNKQSIDHQRYELEQFSRKNNLKIDTWISEIISSRQALNKRKLGEVLNSLNEGDILISCEISRLGRSLLEVMRILETCLNKNCQVWTLKENYRLGNDIQSKVMAFAFGLAAEIERNLISERTRSSLANLRASGKKLGRPFQAESKQLKLSHNTNKVKKLLDTGLSKSEIARIMNVQRNTLVRFIIKNNWYQPKIHKSKKSSHASMINGNKNKFCSGINTKLIKYPNTANT